MWWSSRTEPIVTGWAGGPAALALRDLAPREIFARAIASLAKLLQVRRSALAGAVLDWETHNWSRDPLARGAYSFVRAGCDEAAVRLQRAVAQTLFFAGEATASGEETGTVHGALASGLRAAEEVDAVLG